MYIYVYIFIFIASNAQVKQCHVINLVMINYINFYTIIFCAFDRTKCKKYWNVLTITIKQHSFFYVTEFYFITDPPSTISMKYLMPLIALHKLYSQSASSFLQSDPDFVARISNYTKFQSHHLTVNQFQPEFFQDIDKQNDCSNISQVVPGTHSFASESIRLKRICWSGFYIFFRKSIRVKPLKNTQMQIE